MTKIDDIFANRTLFAPRQREGGKNDLKLLLESWKNYEKVRDYVKKNAGELLKKLGVGKILDMIYEELEFIEGTLNKLQDDPTISLEDFFRPLNNTDSEFLPLGKKKGKMEVDDKKELKKKGTKEERFTFLRLYALKIDENCYLIIGGAIKFSGTISGSGNDDAERAIGRLDIWRNDLHKAQVKNRATFIDYIKKQDEEE